MNSAVNRRRFFAIFRLSFALNYQLNLWFENWGEAYFPSSDVKKTINVCGGGKHKTAKVNVFHFVEPPGIDINEDGELGKSLYESREIAEINNFLDESIKVADALWAQACISIESNGITQHPTVPLAIFDDNFITNQELAIIITYISNPLKKKPGIKLKSGKRS